jgi:hypothetical protein
MISPFLRDKDQIRKMLKKYSKKLTFDDLLKWNTTTWASMIAITAGLDPFKEPANKIVPPAFHAFLPKIEFEPTKLDRYHAYMILKNAMVHVNAAIIEATKEIYKNLLGGGGGFLANIIPSNLLPDINPDDLAGMLDQQLEDFEQRKEFFQVGLSMMSEEEAWTGRHHLLAIRTMQLYEQQQDYVLTEQDFLNIAEEMGLLSKGLITYQPKMKSP